MVHRFPNPPPTGFGIFWYSFDYATVHVIMLSSEHDLTPDSAQYRWFEKDLAQIDRKAHPWVVVTTHRPAYCSQSEIQDYAVATHIADQIDGPVSGVGVQAVWDGMLANYYALSGWDEKGVPTRATLEGLDLANVADDLGL